MFQIFRTVWYLFIKLTWCGSAFIIAFFICLFIPLISFNLTLIISCLFTVLFLYKMYSSRGQLKHLLSIDLIIFLMFLGHLGPISAYFVFKDIETGGFSGFFLIPWLMWCGIWYSLALYQIKKNWLNTPNKPIKLD